MTDLPWLPALSNPTAVERSPHRCRRHDWQSTTWRRWSHGTPETIWACSRCGRQRDAIHSRRGRMARRRGNDFEREVAARLGLRRVGQYGGPDDVTGDHLVIQCKVGEAYPERIDRWLRAIPARSDQLRAVVLGDAPGSSGKRRTLIVFDLDDYVDWYGRRDGDDPC